MVFANLVSSNGHFPRCHSSKPMAGRVRNCSKTRNVGGNGDTANELQERFVPILQQQSNIQIKGDLMRELLKLVSS